jgi:hypothetical protein
MALADPQSVTIGSAFSLPRTTTDKSSAVYTSSDSSASLFVSHTLAKGRRRSYVQIKRRKISTDVLTDVKSFISAGVSVVIDRPEVGFTEAELIELVAGITGWLTAGTNANTKKVLGLES